MYEELKWIHLCLLDSIEMNIDDRQIDTLIGLGKGIIADGKVNQLEAEFLQNWLIQSSQVSDNPF